MDREAARNRIRAGMEAEFLPEPSPDSLTHVDRRMVHAAEYVAYHLGQIDNKLERLIALLEASAEARGPAVRAAETGSSTPSG
jgi:hypothetical protein